MPAKHIRLTADTKGAVKGTNALAGSFTEMKSKMDMFATGARALIGIMGSLNDIVKRSGDFYSQVGALGKGAMEKLRVMRTATGDMIKSTELLRSLNVLNRSEIQMSVQQMEAVGKASVELGRATGQGADSIMKMMTDALSSGRVSSLNKFGLNLETTGTIAEKQSRILDKLTKKYGHLTIAVGDASEANVAMKNSLEVTLMESGQNYQKLSTKITGFVSKGLSGLAILGGGQTRAARDEERYMRTVDMANKAISSRMRIIRKINKAQVKSSSMYKSLLQTYSQEAIALKAAIILAKDRGDTYDEEEKRLKVINKRYARRNILLQNALRLEREIKEEQDKRWDGYIKKFNAGVAAMGKYSRRIKKEKDARKAAGAAIWQTEQGILKGYRDQLKFLELRSDIYEKNGKAIPDIIEDEKFHLEIILAMSKTQREQFLFREKAEKENADLNKKLAQEDKNRLSAAQQEAQSIHQQWQKQEAEKAKAKAKAKALSDKNKAKKKEQERKSNELFKSNLRDQMKAEELKFRYFKEGTNEEQKIALRMKELELGIALKNNDKNRAEALRQQISAIREIANAAGLANEKIKQLGEPYKQLGEIARTNLSAMTKAMFRKSGKSMGRILEESIYNTLRSYGQTNVIKGLSAVADGLVKTIYGNPQGPALMAAGGKQAALGFAMGAAGMYGLSSMGPESEKAAPVASTSTAGAVGGGGQTININNNYSNNMMLSDPDALIDNVDYLRQDRDQRRGIQYG